MVAQTTPSEATNGHQLWQEQARRVALGIRKRVLLKFWRHSIPIS